jgi:gluconate 2-dehydrogenase gamma chain
MDRREALRRTALLLGGAISAPTLAALLAGCETPSASESWTPRAMTVDQGALTATIAEQIIPTTDTPGAREAGVHRFIDRMLAEYYTPDERAAFLAGLADVDSRARAARGKTFVALSAVEQHALLVALDAEAYRAMPPAAPNAGVRGQDAASTRSEGATADQRTKEPTRPVPEPRHQPFFRTIKELTLLGYYTSQVGATRELKYTAIPGRFDGCVPYASIGRAWAT